MIVLICEGKGMLYILRKQSALFIQKMWLSVALTCYNTSNRTVVHSKVTNPLSTVKHGWNLELLILYMKNVPVTLYTPRK